MIFSDKQEAIFNEVAKGKTHINIQATAGAGKTTTILNALKYVPAYKKAIFLSFSNGIVNELKSRIPSHVKASTLHSLGLRFLGSKYKVKIEKNKYFNDALLGYTEKERKEKEIIKDCGIIQDICGFARMTLSPLKTKDIIELCDHFSIIWTDDLIKRSIKLLKKHLKLSNTLSEIDFSDMLYYCAIYPELITEKFDYIFLDEAQDTNKSQLSFIENILHSNGRLISVGDENQTIFAFSGADIESFKRIKERSNTIPLPLNVTYRCSKKVVELAQTIYPNAIIAHENAIEGEVRKGELDEAEEGDMILCRNTKPLVMAFFELLRSNKKSYVVGKDLEKGLIDLVESIMKKVYTMEELFRKIEIKLQHVLKGLSNKGISEPWKHPKYLNLFEKLDIIRFIANLVEKVDNIIPKIHDLFREDRKAIKLLTIHRSKGLECERVFFIQSLNGVILCPSRYAKKDWEKVQENNLLFVAYTRAKSSFIFLEYKIN